MYLQFALQAKTYSKRLKKRVDAELTQREVYRQVGRAVLDWIAFFFQILRDLSCYPLLSGSLPSFKLRDLGLPVSASVHIAPDVISFDHVRRLTECKGKPKVSRVTVFERPGLREFLKLLSEFADLMLFTAGQEGYMGIM
ncbi:hypothetical protein SAY87_029884 [Trapa incisa]|uniref:FCP1 homology domain-containing protein n=1 Tax=Trapa incisa TaxID=236973 RepID=A0AAN7K795_9MYRT|nr:hypothetical protein SAY87_029884 [Trapa incisa]